LKCGGRCSFQFPAILPPFPSKLIDVGLYLRPLDLKPVSVGKGPVLKAPAKAVKNGTPRIIGEKGRVSR
jgi:hypothetical protein